MVVMLAAVGLTLLPRDSSSVLEADRVVIAPFTNLTAEDSLDMHGMVAASWITNGLQQIDSLRVVPWVAVQEEAAALDSGNRLQQLAEVTGAGMVVAGTYSRFGDSLRFLVEITDPISTEVLIAVPPVNGLVREPESAFRELEGRIAVALAVLLDTELGNIASLSLRQPTFEAYREHVIGMDRFSEYRMEEAIEHLTAAYALDSTFVSVLLFAAVANMNIGRHAAVDSLIQIASESRDLLSAFDRQMLGWFHAVKDGDLVESWRIARELAPHSTKLRYQYGNESVGVNRPGEAVAALESIDPTKGFMREWVPY